MNIDVMTIIIPVVVNGLVLIVAALLQLLTFSGGISAFILGVIIYYFTGFKGWVLLIFFFVSANFIGKVGRYVKAVDTSKIQKKGKQERLGSSFCQWRNSRNSSSFVWPYR